MRKAQPKRDYVTVVIVVFVVISFVACVGLAIANVAVGIHVSDTAENPEPFTWGMPAFLASCSALATFLAVGLIRDYYRRRNRSYWMAPRESLQADLFLFVVGLTIAFVGGSTALVEWFYYLGTFGPKPIVGTIVFTAGLLGLFFGLALAALNVVFYTVKEHERSQDLGRGED